MNDLVMFDEFGVDEGGAIVLKDAPGILASFEFGCTSDDNFFEFFLSDVWVSREFFTIEFDFVFADAICDDLEAGFGLRSANVCCSRISFSKEVFARANCGFSSGFRVSWSCGCASVCGFGTHGEPDIASSGDEVLVFGRFATKEICVVCEEFLLWCV